MPSNFVPKREAVLKASADPAARMARVISSDLFGPADGRAFAVRLWDGSVETPESTPEVHLIVRRPGALRRMFLPPTERRLGEAYLRDDVDVDGDLEAAAAA